MEAADPSPLAPTAQRLIAAAERLFATDGLAGVSLRQIVADAGSANSSAVQYHFGGKIGLVQAVVAHRLPDLMQRRALLRERLDPHDLRDVLEGHFLPVLELAETPANFYVSFLLQLQLGGVPRGVLEGLPDVVAAQEGFVADIRRLLPDIEPGLLRMRIQDVQVFNLHAAAERERAIGNAEETEPFALFVARLLDGFRGYLSAAVSSQAQRAATIARTDDVPSALRLV